MEHKLGRRQYIKLIADALVDQYGNTLKEYGTDVDMAEAVVKKLKKYLYFHHKDIPAAEFKEWKRKRAECDDE